MDTDPASDPDQDQDRQALDVDPDRKNYTDPDAQYNITFLGFSQQLPVVSEGTSYRPFQKVYYQEY